MVKISNFRINTHFTALKQLKSAYRVNVHFNGGSYGAVLGQLLAEGTVNVPSGAYVENTTIQSGFDGNFIHLAHEIFLYANGDEQQRLIFTFDQTSTSEYRLRITFTNLSGTTVNLPAFDTEVILRLAQAPFDF